MKSQFLIISKYCILFLPIFFFIGYKWTHLDFRFGDGNAYIYMGYALNQGIIPYRDFFLADPPVFVLFLSIFSFIFGKHYLLFQMIPILLEVSTSILLYLILKRWGNPFAIFAPLLYLFSFVVMSTSDYLTGVQLVASFYIAGYYFWSKKNSYLSGIFWGLACLVKLYAIPLFLGFIISQLLYKDWKRIKKIIIGASMIGLIIMGPFLVFNFWDIVNYLIIHQFNRPHGIDKSNIFQFYVARDYPLLILGAVGLFIYKKMNLVLPYVLTMIFFIFFRDIYYLYLNSLTPLIVIFAITALNKIWQFKKYGKEAISLLFIFLIGFIIYNFGIYSDGFRDRGKFTNAYEVAKNITEEHEQLDLYGSHEVAPLIALLSSKRLFGNYIDTNMQAFGSNALDKKKISMQASEKGVYFLAREVDRPEFNILQEVVYEGFFDKDIFQKQCERQDSLSFVSLEPENKVVIYKCSNK